MDGFDSGLEPQQSDDVRPGGELSSKNIVLCADGTGNSGGKGYGTNVWRLFNAVDLHGHERRRELPRQLAFYDDGVGTENFKLLRVLGGAFGFGLSRKVRELYECLARNYVPGDVIYIFGFSRGAFTARSLAGFIASCGIVDLDRECSPDEWVQLRRDAYAFSLLGRVLAWLGFLRRESLPLSARQEPCLIPVMIKAAFNVYRNQHKQDKDWFPRWLASVVPGLYGWHAARRAGKPKKPSLALKFKSTFGVKLGADAVKDVPIRCVGVWDTVGALGAPFNELRDLIDWLFSVAFHRQDLHRSVEHGFHALSIDDERRTFHPVLWNEHQSCSGDPKKNRIEQVWFAGVHSNVGGGYPKQGLASTSLYWMMQRARACGLRFQTGEISRVQRQANVHDMLYDSRAGLASYYRYAPRDIARLAKQHCIGPAKVHHSVFDRMAAGIQNYVPFNLPLEVDVVGDEPSFAAGSNAGADRRTTEHWKTRVANILDVQRSSELEQLQRRVMWWIRFRVWLYFAMLGVSLSFCIGTLALRWPWLLETLRHLRSARAAAHTAAGGGEVSVLLSWLQQTIAATKIVVAAMVPDTLERVLVPVFDYFASYPIRLPLLLGLLLTYLWLRAWLIVRTQVPFVKFWSPLQTAVGQTSLDAGRPSTVSALAPK